MTSARQRAANRRNAALSTGPRTVAGKARSSRNAWRHGLASTIIPNSSTTHELIGFTKAIVGQETDRMIIDCAREVAEAELEIERVHLARLGLIKQIETEQARSTEVISEVLDSSELELRIFEQATSELLKLDRYERRAATRRNRALRIMEAPLGNSCKE